jgi:hypothetical protein
MGIKNAKFYSGLESNEKLVKKLLHKVINRKVKKFCCFSSLRKMIEFLVLVLFSSNLFSNLNSLKIQHSFMSV